MTDDATDPDDLPNGSGDGDTSSTGGDTSSGGTPEQPDSTHPQKSEPQRSEPQESEPQNSDGTPSRAGVEPPD